MVSSTLLAVLSVVLSCCLSGCGAAATGVASDNIQRCSIASGKDGKVLSISDGTNDRCIAVVSHPSLPTEPVPVLFWFHGSGGNAGNCGHGELGQLALDHGFALVCGEALQYNKALGCGRGGCGTSAAHSGLWQIPEIITNATGTPCQDSDSIEVGYIQNAIKKLEEGNEGLPKMDTSRVFTSGCSMGSAFSGYMANCLKASMPSALSAFATHSTGLKTKGDGSSMPPDEYNTQYQWGECPKCEYFPFAPKKFSDSLGLKACIFDNTGDGDFYKTSQAMAKKWTELGMKAESHFESGGHCQIHSFAEIVNCLDDGSKRLLPKGPAPTPAPSPTPPGPSPSPSAPSVQCQQCFITSCGSERKTSTCKNCVQQNQQHCASSCMPYPFSKAMDWFCNGFVVV